MEIIPTRQSARPENQKFLDFVPLCTSWRFSLAFQTFLSMQPQFPLFCVLWNYLQLFSEHAKDLTCFTQTSFVQMKLSTHDMSQWSIDRINLQKLQSLHKDQWLHTPIHYLIFLQLVVISILPLWWSRILNTWVNTIVYFFPEL